MNIIWFVLAFLFIVLEIGHPGLFYFLSLSFGAFSAFWVSYLNYSVQVQSVTFFVMTLLFLTLLYIFVKNTVHDSKYYRSNLEQLLGKTVMITNIQSSAAGFGKIGGETWSVRLQGEGELKVGMKVVIVGIQGCHLQVTLFES